MKQPDQATEIEHRQAQYVMQCWAAQKDYAPIEAVSAEGCWITTAGGRRIFDLRSAHECINLGFRHPHIVAALRAQMERVIYVTDDFATSPAAQLAETLARLAPGHPAKKIFFCQSGAAAVEAAIKGARLFQYQRVLGKTGIVPDAPAQYPYPYKIISRYKSWHGTTAGAGSVSGDPRRWFQEPLTVPGAVMAPEANAFRPLFGGSAAEVEHHLNYLDYIIEHEGGNNKVAAMLLEPVVGSNGIIPPPEGYLEGVQAICRKWDILLIVDETMSGMGRTGRLFASEYFGIEPDIIVMGKALGAYCPLAATVFSAKVASGFEENIFGHGQSFSGHALAAAGALAGLEVLTAPGFLEEVRRKGDLLGERLQELGRHHTCVGDVRGLGLFWTLELVGDPEQKAPIRAFTDKYRPNIMQRISRYLLEEKDIYIPSDKFGIWVVPPLIVSADEIEWVTDALGDALARADAWINQV